MVLDEQAQGAAYAGSTGLVNGLSNAHLVIDMSTVRPDATRDIAQGCAASDNLFVSLQARVMRQACAICDISHSP
ncbi:MAG: 3-hydroxyisobutyrate dehydrogenase-like beta-hydroxyacid dehydrogenase [Gammaproteobacteria bacterium]|jgi:3-hydroxyisobutyrate dehydrogenase-like beta-hydroxyacid dehydrogenase